MAKEVNRIAAKSSRTSYISTVIGMTLVLWMLGMVGWAVIASKQITRMVKENLQVDVIFKENAREADMKQLEKTLASQPYVLSARFVSKEEALLEVEKELGDTNVIAPLDSYNPLLPSIELFIKEEYADSMARIEADILGKYQSTLVKEVFYNKAMLMSINQSTKIAAWIVLFFAGLLLVVAIALINNTIRLAVYSKRLLIRSMQLVGATEGFIRRPFMWKAFFQGILASLFSLGLILLVLDYANSWFSELTKIQDIPMLLTLFGFLTVLGVFISWISTYFALRKYLRLKSDLLY